VGVRWSAKRVRLWSAWLLVPPFLVLARPAAASLVVGGAVAALGLVLRAWAAGTIRKDAELTTAGPYAHTRNPLYLGTFLIGVGLAVASGRLALVLAFLLFFAVVYGRTIRAEERRLVERFGPAARAYLASVPRLFPRLVPYRPPGGPAGRFEWRRYRHSREYQAALAVAAALAALVVKAWWR